MASSFSTQLRLELMATGENRNTWGTLANRALQHLEDGIAGYAAVAMGDTNYSLTTNNGTDDEARNMYIKLTGAHTATRTLTIPAVSKVYIVENATTGGYAVTVSNGTNTVSVTNGETKLIWTNGTTVSGFAIVGGSLTTGTLTTTGSIELGHASDTTLSRSAAGVLAIEGGAGAVYTGTIELGNASDTTLSRSAAGVVAVEGGAGSAYVSTIELGHASDTTVSRSSAGVIAVEGVTVPLNSTTSTHTAQQIELGHATDTTLSRSAAGVVAVEGGAGSAYVSTIELGHATDTTISRSSSGVIAVEGVAVPLNSTTSTHTAQQIELGHASDTTLSRSAAGVLAVEGNVVPSPGSQAQHDMLVRGASSWNRLAVGTDGQVLKVSSGTPTWGMVGSTFDTVQASTSGSAINFTSIPSWVREIDVIFDAVSLSGTDEYLVQIGDSGGLETSGYVSASTNAESSGTSGSTSGFIIRNFAAGDSTSGVMRLVNITGNVWVASHSCNQGTSGGITGAGTKTLSATLDRLTVLPSGANTFDAGQINICYR